MSSSTHITHTPNAPAPVSKVSEIMEVSRLECMGRLAAGVAHEINTPLQYVGDSLSYMEVSFEKLQRELVSLLDWVEHWAEHHLLALPAADLPQIRRLSAAIPEAITDAQIGAKAVTTIVKALRQFSHPGSDQRMGVDLNQLVHTAVAIAKHEYKRVAEIRLILQPELPLLELHSAAITQSLLNLLVNSAQAIAGQVGESGLLGQIEIRTELVAGGVQLEIRDSGGGIPEAYVDRIFEPFFTTKPPGQGTGQGLAFVWDTIVRQHGGRVDVDSLTDVGTSIRLYFPVAASTDGVPRETNG